MPLKIKYDTIALAAFCRRHHIRRLSLFGSVLRSDFRPDSDIDVLVEFEPDRSPGFLGLARMERELIDLFSGRDVQISTPAMFGPTGRNHVLSHAELQYAA